MVQWHTSRHGAGAKEADDDQGVAGVPDASSINTSHSHVAARHKGPSLLAFPAHVEWSPHRNSNICLGFA